MKNGEKLFWLTVAGYSAYMAGRLFVDQYETTEREGSTTLNIVVLTCLGIAFLVRLDAAVGTAQELLS